MEFDLLKAFAEHPNRVLSRDQLLDLAHNRDWEPFDRSIDIRIARLRRKVETDPSKPQVIKTVRGAGYIFVLTARSLRGSEWACPAPGCADPGPSADSPAGSAGDEGQPHAPPFDEVMGGCERGANSAAGACRALPRGAHAPSPPVSCSACQASPTATTQVGRLG